MAHGCLEVRHLWGILGIPSLLKLECDDTGVELQHCKAVTLKLVAAVIPNPEQLVLAGEAKPIDCFDEALARGVAKEVAEAHGGLGVVIVGFGRMLHHGNSRQFELVCLGSRTLH